MKINEGFSERISGGAPRPVTANENGQQQSPIQGSGSGVSDTLQLSKLAAQLQHGSPADATRAARLSQISQAVRSNTFQVSAATISNALVSEAIQGARR